ncbi:iron-only hydrogenase maturation protein HydG [Proteiniborus ethanoligenes]|uniref:Iron-only hydrogenase maturation protein HydG n=1 Tax=Proteiniborus ethanoligenes TaxID=415015 RepID=A0A1H3NTZ9_9FIRM|nr:[FeFe] hydrogenase H-cluster radical SAM maturase HydG [Proteiniborus ethanoligenes]SDY92213.1 iron-only hydrogenase maturation protein HydG [Proteiniborus ethanoligenes]
MFIDEKYINDLLESVKKITKNEIDQILDKAAEFKGLTHKEVAALLMTDNKEHIKRIFQIAGKIKEHIYGNRIVMFAPLYVSDYCVNRCRYCGYNHDNEFPRRRLTMEEIRAEVAILEKMGHKRLALEAGEDPVNCSIDYILDCMQTIYDMKLENGEIRRVNVNIAATTVGNYRKLKEIGIGTYILFQETYHKPTYEYMHMSGPKKNYEYHLTAFDRAMEAGIDDVGGGVLFGLYDPYFEVLGLMLHNEHLEEKYGVGFHTISVPRICGAEGADLSMYKHIVDDETFKKIVAIIRLAVPFTGMILSTRESIDMRKELIKIGISQISAGSTVEVGGYTAREHNKSQFQVTDNRSAARIIDWLVDDELIPSFCTACYRKGRTGDRFMSLAKSGNIKNVCVPNGLMTLYEYMLDYGDKEFKAKVEKIIQREIPKIQDEKVRQLVMDNIEKLKKGERDLYI